MSVSEDIPTAHLSASDDKSTSHTADAATKTRTPCISTLNKKRYQEIKDSVITAIHTHNSDEEKVESIMACIRTIMKFDPDAVARKYTPEQGKKMTEYRRKKAADMGVSVYEAFNHRNSYQKHKDVMIQRTTECRRRKAQATSAP